MINNASAIMPMRPKVTAKAFLFFEKNQTVRPKKNSANINKVKTIIFYFNLFGQRVQHLALYPFCEVIAQGDLCP
jgi:hypothetical protein